MNNRSYKTFAVGILGVSILIFGFQNCSKPSLNESSSIESYKLDQGGGLVVEAKSLADNQKKLRVVELVVGDLAKVQPIRIKLPLKSGERIVQVIATSTAKRNIVRARRVLDVSSWSYIAPDLIITDGAVSATSTLYIAIEASGSGIECIRAPCKR